MKKTMRLIEKSIADLVIVFRNEINEMYKRDMLDLGADTAAFMHDLRNKGLID
ncbi:MAG: hypothetical protein LIP01_07370 [Tannerellaceae bacterium]|nr:hypothetical protein [Tannerellaceae bacterium]